MSDYNLVDIDEIFITTNSIVGRAIMDNPSTFKFDFSKKDDRTLYTHYFLEILINFIEEQCCNNVVFYNNTLTKDPFRNKLINKTKKIFGFKVWDGVWDMVTFTEMIKANFPIVDDFEVYARSETKPKTFKHIKRFLVKEGYTRLEDTFFQNLANKMIVCG